MSHRARLTSHQASSPSHQAWQRRHASRPPTAAPPALRSGESSDPGSEAAGTGIEVLLRARVQVDLLKKKSLRWPRFESDQKLMTVGAYRPLDDTLRIAYHGKMEPGVRFSEEIRQAIRSSMDFCLVCSPASVKSFWVRREWNAAWVLGMRIVPALIAEDSPKPKEFLELLELENIVLNDVDKIKRFADNLLERADSVREGFFDALRTDFL
jgi:TIR domain